MPTTTKAPRRDSRRKRSKDSDCESAVSSAGSEASKRASKRRGSGTSSTRSRSSRSVGSSSRSTGRTRSSKKTCVESTLDLFPPATYSSAGSRARTCPSATPETGNPLRDLACQALALVSGLTWRESLALNGQCGSWSRTWRTAWDAGAPPSFGSWSPKATRRFASHWNAALSAGTTAANGSSSLPTLTASAYGSTNNGCPGDGRKAYATAGKPSLHSLAHRAGGVLNPNYAERVMGFDPDHTMPLD